MLRKKRRRVVVKPINTKCPFCVAKTVPDYKSWEDLKNYVSDRARILSAQKSGVCTKHQRRLTEEIKKARFLGLLPISQKT